MPKVNLNARETRARMMLMLRRPCHGFVTHFPKSTTLDLNPWTQADTALCAVSSDLFRNQDWLARGEGGGVDRWFTYCWG